MRRKLVAGNWKMHGLGSALAELKDVVAAAQATPLANGDVAICPPFTLVQAAASAAADSDVLIGGQDCHAQAFGAHTGEISAEMLKDAGATLVIVGHSERRADCGETDAIVQAKALAAHRAGLLPIICVGETEAERDAGQAEAVVARQLAGSVPDDCAADSLVIAYEPVWAIGTGRTPTTTDVAQIHAMIRNALINRFGDAGAQMRILYGGSVKPGNAAELMAVKNVDGALVGGASLKAADFIPIIMAAGQA